VFHAVGPGHGKVVIATYLATHESRLRRGIALSVLSSLIQGATAIAAVGITLLVLERSLRHAQGTALFMETASYALVAVLGLALAVRAGSRLLNRARQQHRDHGAEAGNCCHGHGPSVADLEAPASLRHLLATALSIGIRPCSGAILVLILAFSVDLPLAGVGAIVAMSIGTGVTVSALAVASVYARRSALVLAALFADDRGRVALAFDVLAIAGGLLIVLFGLTLLETSLATARHPLL
jgi:nickel/cobalt transporter (NicO) family protein